MRWLHALPLLLLTACAGAPPLPPHELPLDDALFAPPSRRIDPGELFALSEEMREYLRTRIAGPMRRLGRQRGLVEALYARNELQLQYDSSVTRNAAEAFSSRSGNCLSLVIMTAAFAKELGLRIEYRSAYVEETWSRSGALFLRSGHVNVTLGHRFLDSGSREDPTYVTVDFLPADELRGLRTRRIPESTVVAMYMNNRAAEALARERLDDAYWWAREALRADATFVSAYNTLGVIYLRHGHPALAARALGQALERERDNTRVMFNLAQALEGLGRAEEAGALRAELARIEPHPPYHFFQLGQAAMQRGDYRTARDEFAREVARADYMPEFHFWLGIASFRLGELDAARKHLSLALENSHSDADKNLYAAKLASLDQHRRR